MAIRITQLEGEGESTGKTFLVEGSLDFGGAQLLADICRQASLQSEQVSIDLSGVLYVDEAGATVLRWLRGQPQVTLTGSRLFTRAVLEGNEADAE